MNDIIISSDAHVQTSTAASEFICEPIYKHWAIQLYMYLLYYIMISLRLCVCVCVQCCVCIYKYMYMS